jgi:hypothetical protein
LAAAAKTQEKNGSRSESRWQLAGKEKRTEKIGPAADGSHARNADQKPAMATDENQAAETKTGAEQEDPIQVLQT